MRCGRWTFVWLMTASLAASGADTDPSMLSAWTSDVHVDATLGTDVDTNVPLEEALARYKAQGYTRGHAHLDSSLDPAFVAHCNTIQYMELVLQHGHSDHDLPSSQLTSTPVRIWPATNAADNSDAAYQDFFQKYVLQAEPAEAPDVISLPPSFLTTCFDIARASSPLNVQSPPCQALLPSFHVPTCVANDYLQRINTSHPITLPTLVKFDSPTATHCRYGLNMALISVESSGVSVSVATRAPSSDEYTLPLSRDDADTTDASSSTASSSILLGQGRVLFVPSGLAATFQGAALRFCFTDASNFNRMKQHLRVEALLDPAVRAWLIAFQDTTLDASMVRRVSAAHTNWPSFRQWPKPQKLTKESQGDASLSRRERYKIWQDDRKWDSMVKGLTLPVTRPPLLLDAAQNVQRTALTLTWQDVYQARKGDITRYGYEVSWSVDTSALPDAPDKADPAVFKRNLTSTDLVRSALPTTAFGDDFDGKAIQGTITGLSPDTAYTFTLRLFVGDDIGLHSERSASMRTAPIGVPTVVRGQPTAVNLKDSRGHAVPNCAALSWLPPADDGGSDVVGYVVSARYDPTQSPPSAPTEVELEATAAVSWQPFNVTSQFDVMQSVVVTTRELTLDPKSVAGTVCNLRQRETYQFQVAAFNALGVGPLSMWTSPLQMTVTGVRQDVVRGVGAPHFHRVYARNGLDDLVRGAPTAPTGPVMHLSDKQQLLQPYQLIAPSLATAALRYDASNKLVWSSWFAHVWPGHFSPKAYSVVAELVVADPVLANKPLTNDVQDRLVLVRRGGLPMFNKVLHAQNAGALGVVIVDADGLCDADGGTGGGFDHQCSVGSNHAFGEGFGAQDDAAVWAAIRIPHVLLRRGDAADLVARLPTAESQLLSA